MSIYQHMSLIGRLKNDYLAPLEYCILGAINFNEPPVEFFVPFNCYFYLKMESLNKKSLHAATLRKKHPISRIFNQIVQLLLINYLFLLRKT